MPFVLTRPLPAMTTAQAAELAELARRRWVHGATLRGDAVRVVYAYAPGRYAIRYALSLRPNGGRLPC